jgi:type I restriction enzyme S subunit
MSNDWFFEKFALIADAPGAVERMRGLVMWSAFSGAFSDEPRDQPMPEKWAIEGTPTLPPIPSSWSWQRGSDVFDVIRGVSYTKGDSSDTPVDGSFPILRANNIGRGINFNELVYVRAGNIRDEQFVRPGDILIAMSSGSKRLVGKAAPIVTEFQGGFGAFCGVIRNKSNVPDTVLARYFESPQYTSWVTSAGRGIGINNLSKGDLNSLPIPTPPLAEQKRIVTRVDELMGICDALESQQQERDSRKSVLVRSSLSRFAEAPTSENLGYLFHKSYDIPPSELRKSILTLAVRGKLVPQDPNDEPAVEIKKQIAKRMSAIRNQRHHTFAATEDQTDPPFPIPHNWEWMPFGTLGEFLGGGTPSKDNPAYWNGEIPWVSPKDMKRPYICDSIDHVTPLGADASSGRLIPTGALLIVVRGMILAHTFPVAITTREVTINQDMKALRLTVPEIGEYLLRCCTALTGAMLSNVERSSHGTCRIPTEALSSFLVPIPPLAEQRRIVAKVDQLMALVDELARQQEASRENATKMLDAIVQEMTSGGQGIAATLES